jgi:hypothetical protein
LEVAEMILNSYLPVIEGDDGINNEKRGLSGS